MHVRSIAVACLLVPVCWIVTSMPSHATPICWIERIAKANGGIDVYFRQNAVLRISVMENSGATSTRYTAHNGVVRDEGGREQDHLFVKDGVDFSASQLAHDSCTYKVTASGEVGKVTARAAMHLPGLPPAFATQTIGTDGTETD
jgi:hypothetical protein